MLKQILKYTIPLLLLAPVVVFGINISVPSAPGSGYFLQSTSTGAYIATGTPTFSNGFVSDGASSTIRNFVYGKATGTSATTTNSYSSVASSSNLYSTNSVFASSTIGKSTTTNATTTSLFANVASTTNIWSINSFFASSTIGQSTTTNATTTHLYISGDIHVGGSRYNVLDGDGLAVFNGQLNCNTATGSQFGCLSTTDWSIFNNKVSSSSLEDLVSWTNASSSPWQVSTLLVTGSSTLQNFTYRNATGTNATTTNFYAGIASTTQLFATNSTFASTTIGKSTTTEATTTNLYVSGIASTSALYLATGNGLLGVTNGLVGIGIADMDYQVPLTFGDGLTRTVNDIDCDIANGSTFGCLSSTDWTTFNNKVATTRALTIAGTANQITSSAGSQDLSADRTWTLSLPNHVIFPSSFQAALGSTTNATSTTFFATTASTSALYLPLGACDTLDTDSTGKVICGTDAQGGASEYDAWTHPSAGVSATTSRMIFDSASSTFTRDLNITGNSTTTHATTTTIAATTHATTSSLTVSGNFTASQLTSALILTGSDGLAAEYAGSSNPCTNQVPTTISAEGALGGCTSINNSWWSGTDLSVANGGTGLSTFGGTNTVLYTTAADTLASEAAFTYDPTLNRLTASQASFTLSTTTSATSTNLYAGIASTTQLWALNSVFASTTIGKSTTTQATTTSLYVSGNASTSALYLSTGTGCLSANSAGLVSASGAACGAGGGVPNSKWATSTDITAISLGGALKVGIGTSTPQWALQIASSTGPQLTLSDSSSKTLPHWSVRNAGGNLYFSTSSASTFATTSTSALTLFNVGQPALGIATTSFIGQLGIGSTSPSLASTTISMGKLQLDGYSPGGTRYCMFVTDAGTWTVVAGACNP